MNCFISTEQIDKQPIGCPSSMYKKLGEIIKHSSFDSLLVKLGCVYTLDIDLLNRRNTCFYSCCFDPVGTL